MCQWGIFTIALGVLTTFSGVEAEVLSVIGSSAVAPYFEKCLPRNIRYDPAGSGKGAEAARNGFVGVSDVPIGLGDDFLECPLVSGGIGVIANLGRKKNRVKLTPCVLAGIFQGTIRSWSHPAIRALNPRLKTNIPIMPVARSDSSGSTQLFTRYLSRCSAYTGSVGTRVDWPDNVITASGTDSVLRIVEGTLGAITYASSTTHQVLLEGERTGRFFKSFDASAPMKFTALIVVKKNVPGLGKFLETVYAANTCASSAGLIPLGPADLAKIQKCIDDLR